MNIFESLENLGVSEECFEDIVTMVEAMLSETSDERAKWASDESHKRYNNARTRHDSLKEIIKRNKKSGFYTDDEIKEIKQDFEQAKQDLDKAAKVSVRDNKNQFNRDKRLGRV